MNLGKEIGSAGKELGTVNVKVGPRFLNLFSQQLYSSPNKAFEELLSNSWDAGADTVYVKIPDNLSIEDSTVWVLDNGSSMNAEGLQDLWNVAHSPKVTRVASNGRKPIGKFGIGKLATYILCNELTYVCKYNDGIIRAVTMDYRRIDETAQDNDEISPDGLGLPLSVRELKASELTELIKRHDSNEELIKLINSDVPKIENSDFSSYEFGDEEKTHSIKSDTWTLVLLTALKEAGTKLQSGRIKRILRVALPLGNSMTIVYNGETLSSAKSDVRYTEWKFDEKFPIADFSVQLSDNVTTIHKVIGFDKPYSHIKISGLSGELLGSIKVFERSIAGDNLKSEDMGYSNGFVINVLGRIINVDEPYFGLKNLQHTTWSQFRGAVRADWLDKYISVTREDVQEGDELAIFRAFLLACFNKARSLINSKETAARDDIGKTLIKTFSALPLEPLHRTVSSKAFGSERPNFITVDSESNQSQVLDDWDNLPRKDYGKIIERVSLDDSSDDNEPIYKYDLSKRSLLINSQHPFVKEHSATREQKELLQDSLLVEMLTDSFISDLGLSSEIVDEISNYRELVFRLIAKISRRTGGQIADLIDSATQQSIALEQIVGDALEFLGFSVKRMAKPGEPEGVAAAILPAKTFRDKDTKVESDVPTTYSFTY